MPMTVDQIVEETRQWPSDVVADLVDRIMLSRHGGLAPEIAAAWQPVINRRVEEIRSGQVEGIPGEVVAERIRRIVGR
jgi:hypothetical protein